MEIVIGSEPKQWQAVADHTDHPHVNQSYEWGEAYGALPGISPVRFLAMNKGKPVGALQAFEWKHVGISLAMTCGDSGSGGGPLVREDLPTKEREEISQSLMQAFMSEAQKRGALKMSLFTEPGREWKKEILGKRALIHTPIAILPKTPEEMLQKHIDAKTRNQILKAEKNGIEVREGNRDDLATYRDMQRELVQKKHLPESHLNSLHHLELLWDHLAAKGMMKLYLATLGGKILGGALILGYQKGILYISGVTTDAGRIFYVSNLIQWRAIHDAIKRGCTFYNLGGGTKDETDPRYGITLFKMGFGGEFAPFERYTSTGNRALRFLAYRTMHVFGRNEWFPLLVYP